MDLSMEMIALCIVICCWITYKSYKNKNRGIIDSGAQNVVTIGVLFTFIGIAIGLYNFDLSVEVEKMNEQLDIFLDGMKIAFVTSIIGMVFGIVIKRGIQFDAEQKEDNAIKQNLSAMNLTKGAVENNTTTLLAALNAIRERIDANGNAQLQINLNRLVTAMETFVVSSNESRNDMKDLSVRMSNQAKMLERLSDTLTKSIEDFGEKQRENLAALSDKIIDSGDKQAQRLDDMNRTIAGQSTVLQQLSDTLKQSIEDLGEKQRENLADLSDKIIDSGKEQSKRLDKMNETIDKMLTATETAQKNSQELLAESKAYQQQSLANDKEQAKILTENTEKIAAMKEAFDKFLQNMAENYSKELINALALSMEKLNTQLQEQFGDNFKELNAAVKDVVKWQENYKETVELTTDELKHINQVFTEFTQTISVEISKHIETLATNLQTFGESTDKNVDVQKDLRDAVIKIGDAVEQSKTAVEQMQAMTKNFGQFSENVLKTNKDALEDYNDTVKEKFSDLNNALEGAVGAFVASVTTLQGTALNLTVEVENYLRDFGDVSKDVIENIRKKLEEFDKDFRDVTTDAVKELARLFEEIAKNTDKRSEVAINSLAGALVKINDRMIENYNALIQRIAEIDKIIREGGQKS